ncbi:nucleotide-sugar transporter domain-containing protein [Ditylenchus destructor]|nr:nucleotide-sugar transporter domain-containing protein [Ditylenchus destructor]
MTARLFRSLATVGRCNRDDLYIYVGMTLLTLQQASMPLMARSARDREQKNVFITTVNVLFMDLIKIGICSVVLIANDLSITRFLASYRKAIVGDPVEMAKLCFLSLIYTIQNNLYYIALSNLESTTFCVVYQMKILTTALMLRLVLKKPLSWTQWLALVVLIVGVTNVQLQYQPPKSVNGAEQNPTLGFLVVFIMCFTSAFAGVGMEKILKQSQVDVCTQNLRLATFGLVISLVSMILKDYDNIRQNGLLVGFDRLVWIMTFTNATGGLLISVVIKYADNILKAYAQSMAIIGAAVGSWFLFDFLPNSVFMFGVALVIISIYLYTIIKMHLENSFSASSSVFPQSGDSLSMTPTQLLSLAIKKRRSLYDSKDYDFRRVLGNTSMISTLCKYLGEGRAKRRRNRRSKRRHSTSKSHWTDRTMSESEDEPECMDHSKLVIAPRGNDQEGTAKLADPFDLTSDQTAQIVPSQNEQTIQTYACDDEQTMDETTVEPDRKRRKLENLHRPVSIESSLDEFFSSLAASPSDPYEFSASDSPFDGKRKHANQNDSYKNSQQLAVCSY